MEVPKRACILKLVLEADTRQEIIHALRNIETQIAREEMTKGVSGGPDSGYIYEYVENGSPSHDEYFEQIEAYLESKRTS